MSEPNPSPSHVGRNIGIVIFFIILLIGVAVGGYFIYKEFSGGGAPAGCPGVGCPAPPNFPTTMQQYEITNVSTGTSLTSIVDGNGNCDNLQCMSLIGYQGDVHQRWMMGFLNLQNPPPNTGAYVIQNIADQNQNLKFASSGSPIAGGIGLDAPPSSGTDFTDSEPWFWQLTYVSDGIFTISPYLYPCYNISGGTFSSTCIPVGYSKFNLLLNPANSSDTTQQWKFTLITP